MHSSAGTASIALQKERRERGDQFKLIPQQPYPDRTIIGSYRLIFPFLRKYYMRIAIEIAFLSGFVLFAVIAPFLSRYAIDEVILARDIQALYTFILLVLGLFVFAFVWKFFASLWQALTRQGFSVDLRRELFLSLQEAPSDLIGRLFKPGEIAYRYLADVDTLEGRMVSFITQGVISLVHLLVVAFIVIRIHVILGLLAFGSIFAYLLIYWLFRERILDISKEVREFFEGVMGFIAQYCSSLTEIRLLNGYPYTIFF